MIPVPAAGRAEGCMSVIPIPTARRAQGCMSVIPIPAAGRADGCLSVIPSLSGTVVPVGGGMAGLPERLSFIPSACMSLRRQASLTSGLSYRNLNQRDPLFGVFLVPYAVDVACAWLSGYLHAVLVHVSESLGECLVETLVRAYMLNA